MLPVLLVGAGAVVPPARGCSILREVPMKHSLALAAFFTLIASCYGQIATTTSLVGTVSDSSGRAIAGAKITAVEAATLDKYNAVTNQDGNYRIDFVRVGSYTVSAEFPGFKGM